MAAPSGREKNAAANVASDATVAIVVPKLGLFADRVPAGADCRGAADHLVRPTAFGDGVNARHERLRPLIDQRSSARDITTR
jgi:hypothetical protein